MQIDLESPSTLALDNDIKRLDEDKVSFDQLAEAMSSYEIQIREFVENAIVKQTHIAQQQL